MPSQLKFNTAVRTLLAGGIVAYPTEAVYGLGCLPDNSHSLQRLIRAKRRRKDMGLIVIADSVGQLDELVELPDTPLRDEILSTWPGPVTWVLPARRGVLDLLTGGRDTLAVRVTAHPIAAALCRRTASPIVSTSANVSGRGPARTALEVRLQLGSSIDFILAGPLGGLTTPTTIRDGQTGKVLR